MNQTLPLMDPSEFKRFLNGHMIPQKVMSKDTNCHDSGVNRVNGLHTIGDFYITHNCFNKRA